jgi:hypothetical protein
MHGVVREVEEERARSVSLDEVHRARRQGVGEVRGLVHRSPPIEQRIGPGWLWVDVGMLSGEKSEELVKATRHRMKTLRRSEVPFTEQRRPITGRLEAIRKRGLRERKTSHVAHWSVGIEFVPKPLRISAGHQAGPCGAAVWTTHIRVGESDSAGREGVDVGRWNVLASMDADIGISHVIANDDDNVWRPRLPERGRVRDAQKRDDGNRQRDRPCRSSFHRFLQKTIYSMLTVSANMAMHRLRSTPLEGRPTCVPAKASVDGLARSSSGTSCIATNRFRFADWKTNP